MKNNPLPRLDNNAEMRERLLRFCRLQPGDIWDDPDGRHRIGCKSIDDRLAIWESHFSILDDDTPDTMYFDAMDETDDCLRRYIDVHIADFEPFVEKN
jgi:hypothetical protein